MDWKDEEVESVCEAMHDAYEEAAVRNGWATQERSRKPWADVPEANKATMRVAVRIAMTRTMKLAAARGGTMTAPVLEMVLADMAGEFGNGVERIRAHISALGARNAVLEAEVASLRETARLNAEERDAARKSADELQRQRDSSNEALEHAQERLSAAVEGNRELVRRTQQAEGELEVIKGFHRGAVRFWKEMKERADAAEARCATLSAAGQVLSAHVDKIAEDVLSDPNGNAGCRYVDCCRDAVAEVIRRLGGVPKDEHSALDTERNKAAVSLERIRARAASDEAIDNPEEFREWAAKRIDYPCSATCTHDDAATPGHPERVKRRSEAVNAVTGAPDPVGALAVRAGAKPGREIASYRAGYEQACDDMRAACWEAVQERMRFLGITEKDAMWSLVKSAIEGAVP